MRSFILLLCLCTVSLQLSLAQDVGKTVGAIERLDPQLDEFLAADAEMEVLSDGHDWTEGPVWVPSQKMLLFSDIPPNSIFAWSEKDGPSLYLKPAGYSGSTSREGEPGSNGLLLDAEGNLILCQHGDRQMARYTGSFDDPEPTYETIVGTYEGKRFNSPNDAAYFNDEWLYFTDPPYGLVGNINDPAKEIPYQGVYRVGPSGKAELLTDALSRPNGIAFSPDRRKMYVANSHPKMAIWMQYDLDGEGNITQGQVFYDATDMVGKDPGLPDGLKVHSSGTLFATGPGGVWIFSAEGKVLGKLKTGQATANCAFDDTESYLYITADRYLLRIKMKN